MIFLKVDEISYNENLSKSYNTFPFEIQTVLGIPHQAGVQVMKGLKAVFY